MEIKTIKKDDWQIPKSAIFENEKHRALWTCGGSEGYDVLELTDLKDVTVSAVLLYHDEIEKSGVTPLEYALILAEELSKREN